jgi:chorismate-pyruvate lyase
MMVDFDFLYPLNEFYRRSRLDPPSVAVVEAAEIDEPYRSLLAHGRGMTSTLEAFHEAKCRVRVLDEFEESGILSRRVVLNLEPCGKPVEFAAGAIHMHRFPAHVQDLIRGGEEPLGAILRRHDIPHQSRPKAFLRLRCDAPIAEALGLDGEPVLYGRRNTLFDGRDNPLVEIVEVLPPA